MQWAVNVYRPLIVKWAEFGSNQFLSNSKDN